MAKLQLQPIVKQHAVQHSLALFSRIQTHGRTASSARAVIMSLGGMLESTPRGPGMAQANLVLTCHL